MSVINSAIVVALSTLVSRVFGFIRECVMSALIGTTIYMDCFLVGLKLANTCRRIFAEGAFNSSFLPRFMHVIENDNREEANKLLSQMFSLMTIFVAGLVAISIIFYPEILTVMASGFRTNPHKFDTTVKLGRIMFPFLLLVSITALFCGAANALKRFALPTMVHATVNICSVLTMTMCYFLQKTPEEIAYALSVSVLISGIIQVIIMLFYVKKLGFQVRFTLQLFSKRVNDILRNMVPGLISAGVWQINLLIDTYVCSYLPTGTITCLSLADRLNQFPLATLGTALSTAMLPALSAAVSKNDKSLVKQEFQSGLLFATLLVFPAFIILHILSEPIIATVYQRGIFGGDYVKITALALQAFVLGIPWYILTKILSAAFFAYKDTRTPTICAIISVIFNIIFIVTLTPFGKHYSVALSTTLSAFIDAILLIIAFNRQYCLQVSASFVKKLTAQVLSAICLYIILDKFCLLTWSAEYGKTAFKWVYSVGSTVGALLLYNVLIYGFLAIFRCKRHIIVWKPSLWSE